MRWRMWLWMRLLVMMDRLLGTHLLEWELVRRQRRVEQLIADMDVVNQEVDTLAEELAVCRLVLCVVELKARSERDDLDDWLRFTPHSNGEESLLDSAIECLVKPRLASIDAEPEDSGHYTYRLFPDWSAIVDGLRNRSVAPELLAWLEEQS